MHSELTSVPSILHCRVKRILPFLTHNIYLSNTRLPSALLGVPIATDPQQQQHHLEACMEQSKPWEWLEDYVGDHENDAPISLALFHARKSKKTENTFTRWYRYGFPQPRQAEPIHVSLVDAESKKPRQQEENDTPLSQSNKQPRKPDMEEGELP